MPVVSVSLPEDLVGEVDAAIGAQGFGGRSEFLRAALRHYLQERTRVRGHVHGSITVVYDHGREPRVSEIRHAFHDVVLSLMHTHCEPEVCMDVLIVGGPGERVQALVEVLERDRHVRRARLVPVA